MYDNYIIPTLKELPCKMCLITINTSSSKDYRPHGYIMEVDGNTFLLSTRNECKTLMEKLKSLNIQKMQNIIKELSKL